MHGAVSGIILAGGSSRRMGRDKATLPWADGTLLQWAARCLAAVTDEVLVIGAPHGLPDRLPGHGPLGGMVTGLEAMRGQRAVVVACDHPFLSADLLSWLRDLTPQAQATVPLVQGQAQPLLAVYRADVLPVARQQLEHGQLRLGALLERLTVRWVAEGELRSFDPELRSFRNLNTPEEWKQAVGAGIASEDAGG